MFSLANQIELFAISVFRKCYRNNLRKTNLYCILWGHRARLSEIFNNSSGWNDTIWRDNLTVLPRQYTKQEPNEKCAGSLHAIAQLFKIAKRIRVLLLEWVFVSCKFSSFLVTHWVLISKNLAECRCCLLIDFQLCSWYFTQQKWIFSF